MAQKFKLVQLAAKPTHPEEGKKYFAIPVSSGVAGFHPLCEMISARSTVSSADVKAVLDSLNYVIDRELREGRIVRLGELGSMRVTFGSEGVKQEKDFTAVMIRKPRISFTPGRALNETRKLITFAKLSKKEGEPEQEGAEVAKPEKGKEEGAANI